jgi:tRNA-specific 2-thiouridylase
MIRESDRVAVAMSGGVDSSVAAKLLVDRGFNVVGVTMKLWDFATVGGNVFSDSSCCSLVDMQNARDVCHQLGIPHYILNFSGSFRKMVIDNFSNEYLLGRTPNPCIRCNTYVKWKVLLNKLGEFGCDCMATGHYAIRDKDKTTGRIQIRMGKDRNKDQSYVLWGLSQESLSRTLFPLGEYTKFQVRSFARKANLKTAEKAESQEICFIPDNDYRRFLREYRKEQMETISSGNFMDEEGNILGQHEGYPNYTVGQRRRLRLALGKPMYVKEIRPGSNEVILAEKENIRAVGCKVEQVNWVSIEPPESNINAHVKIRYKHTGVHSEVIPLKQGKVQINFHEKQEAVTPGQSAVFYSGDILLGGGIITQVYY